MPKVSVIGAGLAGCEAAWQLAQRNIEVALYEMKPQKFSPAHHNEDFAELVCSNSLKSDSLSSAAGLLKEEMSRLGSLIIRCARQTAVPAGGALAVDRELFSRRVTEVIEGCPFIKVCHKEVTKIPEGPVIIATGPLTSDEFAITLQNELGQKFLSFYDAASPVVTSESIDLSRAFFGARYNRGTDDYLNCPMNQGEYLRFLNALVNAETVPLKSFENEKIRVYEGCMPIEVLAKRGEDAIRFGPLKPVGLKDPRTGKRPWAVVQLRAEDNEKKLYNLVGFQTNLRFPEQKRVFSMIPGLEHADFVRYGVMHRNTYLNSPAVLDSAFRLKNNPCVFFAGQITGVEGYIESAASGILAGINAAMFVSGKPLLTLPRDTMTGALLAHVFGYTGDNFQPIGCSMGLLPALSERVKDKSRRYALLSKRALDSLDRALESFAVQNDDSTLLCLMRQRKNQS